MTVLFASSELEEVKTLASRIVVMAGGRITGEFPAAISPRGSPAADSR